MVSRIEVIPSEVRGYGNIVEPKTSDDFTLVDSELSYSDGVYTLTAEGAPVSYDGVALTSNKSVLSYADSETCTLSAQLMDGSSADTTSGVSVEFFKGTTSLGTATTNSSGVATKTYTSTGAGDLSLTAKVGSLVSETYSLQDCLLYKATEQTFTSTSTKVENALYTNIGDIAGSNWEFEYKLKYDGTGGGFNIGAQTQYTPPSTANYRLYIGSETSTRACFNNRTNASSSSYTSMSKNTYHTLKLVKNNSSVTAYLDGTSFDTKTISWLSDYNAFDLYWLNWNSTNYAKEIKLKLL